MLNRKNRAVFCIREIGTEREETASSIVVSNSTIAIARRRGNYDTRVVVRGRWFLLRPLEKSLGRGDVRRSPASIYVYSRLSLSFSWIFSCESARKRDAGENGRERARGVQNKKHSGKAEN